MVHTSKVFIVSSRKQDELLTLLWLLKKVKYTQKKFATENNECMVFYWRPGVKGLSSDIASSLCRLCSETFSSQNGTWCLNVSASLDKDKYEILNKPE